MSVHVTFMSVLLNRHLTFMCVLLTRQVRDMSRVLSLLIHYECCGACASRLPAHPHGCIYMCIYMYVCTYTRIHIYVTNCVWHAIYLAPAPAPTYILPTCSPLFTRGQTLCLHIYYICIIRANTYTYYMYMYTRARQRGGEGSQALRVSQGAHEWRAFFTHMNEPCVSDKSGTCLSLTNGQSSEPLCRHGGLRSVLWRKQCALSGVCSDARSVLFEECALDLSQCEQCALSAVCCFEECALYVTSNFSSNFSTCEQCALWGVCSFRTVL